MESQPTRQETTEAISSRRRFLGKLWVGLGIIALVELIWVVWSYLKPVRIRETAGEFGDRIMAGPVAGFSPNSVTAFPRGHFYLACLPDGGFLAIHRKCTHLGCTVPWVEKKGQFICPCHASVFDIHGGVVRSPADRALDIFPVVIENKVIYIDTGRRIQRGAFLPEQVVYPKGGN